MRDMVRRGHLDAKFVSSNDKIADTFTKPLLKDKFIWLHLKLLLHFHSDVSLWEGIR